MEQLRTRALLAYAHACGYTKLLLGDSATLLAARVVSEIAKGRKIASLRIHLYEPTPGVPCAAILRPIADFLSEEVFFFLR
eukprot:3116288-Rhodomonas_salina.2